MAVRGRKKQPVKRKFKRREITLAKKKGIRPKHYRKPPKKRMRPRLDPRDLWPEEHEFMARFRLPVQLVEHLSHEFSKSKACTTKGDRRGRGIPIFHKVCYALRYMATGASYKVIADTQGGCSKSTVCRCVYEFVRFLYAHRHRYIYFPKTDLMHENAVRFAVRHGFPQVVGCVDGTYIPITRPKRNEEAFVCRHGYHALNAMIVSDSDQRIIFIEPSMAGSQHDQAVFDLSDLGSRINTTNFLGDYVLLGDSGYSLTKHVLTPFKGAALDTMDAHEIRYQKGQTSTRSSVERAIGQLKTRWRCLSKRGSGVIKMRPVQASWLVVACAVLHNLCLDWGVSELSPQNNFDPDREADIQVRAYKRLLRAKKRVNPNAIPQAVTVPNYQEGILRQQELIYKRYGGPDPHAEEKARRRAKRRRLV